MFECGRCGKTFNFKHHLKQHYNRKKACKPLLSDTPYKQLLDVLDTKEEKQPVYTCKYCNRPFSQSSNRSRHQASCQGNNGHSHTQVQQDNHATIINNYNITVNNVNNNITINSFGLESYAHLTHDFIKKCVGGRLEGMETLVKAIHFNDEVPENQNVRHKSLKKQMVQVNEDGCWKIKDANDVIHRIITKSSQLANNCYHNDNDWQNYDANELDSRIHMFLVSIVDAKDQNYYKFFRRIRALIVDFTSRTS